MDYRERRQRLYDAIRQEGFFTWDYMYGEEYALATVLPVDEKAVSRLRQAANELGRVYYRVMTVLREGDDALLRDLGVPESALAVVRLTVPLEAATVVGRFDFAQTPDGDIRMLEFNSDTPTGIVEAYHVNERVCAHLGVSNPNRGMERQLREAFQAAVAAYRQAGYATAHIAFSALGWHEEDAATARYLLEASGLDGMFVPLEDLRVTDDRLYALQDGELRPIDVLYRLHAIEKLDEDKDEDGYPSGRKLLELVAAGRLALINPPGAFLVQSKAVQALIWSLHEDGSFFTPEEQETIARYMLPTYLENRFEGHTAYVRKPILGREGGAVTLYTEDGSELERDGEELYWEQPMVYQQLAELAPVCVETIQGPYEGRLLWGAFLIGGEPSALLARVGERITGNLSCYVPVALAGRNK